MKRKLIVLGVVALLLLVVIGVISSRHHANPKTSTPATAQRSKPIPTPTSVATILNNNDNPTKIDYKVTGTTQPVAGWFISSVIATNSYGSFNQFTILHQGSTDQTPVVVAGPTTSFPIGYLHSIGVPDAVIQQVPTFHETP